jgi:hypothetical protein
MSVVTSAISSMIVNTVGVMTPSSSPTVRMTISVSPLVFISSPSVTDECQVSPTARAASAAPPNLPAMATAITSAVTAHSAGEVSRSTRVLRPTTMKNTGSSR